MVSDSIHSMSDIFVTVIARIGVKISHRQADKSHPYSHERMECVASLILSAILLFTSISIGFLAIQKILAGNYDRLAVASQIAFIAAIVSILAKENNVLVHMLLCQNFKFCNFYGGCLASLF